MQSNGLSPFDTQHIDCVLAAGEASDLDAMRTWCSSLDESSYGQVFIEVESAEQIESLSTPLGMNVTWILRDRPHHRPHAAGDCQIRAGQALSRAVDAWLDEWLRAESTSTRGFVLWLGARTNPIMCDYWARIEDEFAALHADSSV